MELYERYNQTLMKTFQLTEGSEVLKCHGFLYQMQDVALRFLFHAAFGDMRNALTVMRQAIHHEQQLLHQEASQKQEQTTRQSNGFNLPFCLLRAAIAARRETAAAAAAQELHLIAALRPALCQTIPDSVGLLSAIAEGAGWPEEAEAILSSAGHYERLALMLERRGCTERALEVAATKAPLVRRELQQRLGKALVQSGDKQAGLKALLAAAAPYGKNSSYIPTLDLYKQQSPTSRGSSLPFSALCSGDTNISGTRAVEGSAEEPDLMLEDSYVLQLADTQEAARDIVETTRSPKLFSWYAAMLEEKAQVGGLEETAAKKMLEEAITLYERGKNWQQAAKLLLSLGLEDEAVRICVKSKDHSAAAIVAAFYQRQRKDQMAIKLLLDCGCISRAIHLCELTGNTEMEAAAVAAALRGEPHDAHAAAELCIRRGSYDKAVALLQASGRWPEALEVCLRNDLLQSLRGVCSELVQEAGQTPLVPQHSDIAVRAATFLFHHHYSDEGIGLLIACGLLTEAVTLCASSGISIPQTLTDAVTKQVGASRCEGATGTPTDSEQKEFVKLAKQLAALLNQQQQWHNACALLALAGFREEALDSLAATMDPKAIVTFAGQLRNTFDDFGYTQYTLYSSAVIVSVPAAHARQMTVYSKAAQLLASLVTADREPHLCSHEKHQPAVKMPLPPIHSKGPALSFQERYHYAETAMDFFAKANAFQELQQFAHKAAQAILDPISCTSTIQSPTMGSPLPDRVANFAVFVQRREGTQPALKLLRLAVKHLGSLASQGHSQKEQTVSQEETLNLLEDYTRYAEAVEADSVAHSHKLLQDHKRPLRKIGLAGPLARMTELLAKEGQMQQAISLLQEMYQRGFDPESHMNAELLLQLKSRVASTND
ncbi:tetratricopeptide repeat-containing protein [Cyclospora cayetanensis]|uniref:Tetratricopeptide repeat-containing protein n=1 Tax=Cyclospora cayetanensis TaxID=88456 RepID=A0A1D3D641_9EIME|nr:tetratricopeptide repeat-containing protein [Cyclospora cayetanensis]